MTSSKAMKKQQAIRFSKATEQSKSLITAIALMTFMEYVAFNISLPKDIADKLEEKRGDIPRSTFIARMLGRALGVKRK